MSITKQYLNEQIEGLSKQREHFIVNANMAAGAIQTLQSLVSKLEIDEHDARIKAEEERALALIKEDGGNGV